MSESVNDYIRRRTGHLPPEEQRIDGSIEPSVLADRLDDAMSALDQLGEEFKTLRASLADDEEE